MSEYPSFSSTNFLDVTVAAGAIKRELEYAQAWAPTAGVKLRAKYRPLSGSIPQWAKASNGRSGTARIKKPGKGHPNHRPLTLVVDGLTGKRSWVES